LAPLREKKYEADKINYMETKSISESQEIIQDNLDYTLFSWSKQKGIAPLL
jgi:hypothetical protein